MHPQNSFITLTYDKEHLPPDYSIHLRVWQLFMKKLRNHVPQKLRFFACGEYGDKDLRPHYHALIFGWMPPDLQKYRVTPKGHIVFKSKFLDGIWENGLTFTGTVTYQSAGYCARYVVKKQRHDLNPEHYTRIHPDTGRIVTVEPEFAVQSRNPGLGSSWFDKYSSDCFPSDFLIINQKKISVPSFYTRKLSEKEIQTYKRSRKAKAVKHRSDNTPERLKVREEVFTARINQLKRE